MATAVARAATVEKVTAAPQERTRPARGRTKRRIKTRASMLSMVTLFVIGLALPFAYTNVYANLKKTSYSKSDYEVRCWKERVDNERLKVLIDSYSSYGRVKDGAAKMGMVPATKYDYVDQTQAVASR
jgi:cell division protein FtsL